MELLLLIGGIWLLFWIFKRIRGPSARNATKPAGPRVYRPSSLPDGKSPITFPTNNPSHSDAGIPTAAELGHLHDAFTGAPLNPTLGLYRCSSCQVYYHTESYQVLAEENGGRCVACSSTTIISLTSEKARQQGGRDYSPDVVTLDNYRQHAGHVITFEGRVNRVLTSRRGSDYAVMFENKSWTKGLKLVFFRGAVRKVGGSRYINGLTGKSVRMRGLLINHETFGYEIIVAEKSMILSVK